MLRNSSARDHRPAQRTQRNKLHQRRRGGCQRACTARTKTTIELGSMQLYSIFYLHSANLNRESTHSTPGSRISHASPGAEIAQTSPTNLSSSYSQDLRKQNNKGPAHNNAIITFSDSDEDFDKARSDDDDLYAAAPPRPVPVPEEEDPMSEEEQYPELIKAAEERARMKEAAKLQTNQAMTQQSHLDDDDFFDTAPKIQNPIVEVFISSEIEGSKALMVKRRLLARLKEVKSSWCDRQEINGVKVFSSAEAKDEVFLTYKKKRLFDATSCHSLGFKLDAEGQVEEGPGTFEGKVHLEAWTEETYDIYQKREAKRLKQEKEGIEEEEKPEPEVAEKRMRLILKSREHGEHKLKARLTTPIAKLIESFRQDKSLPEQMAISLHLDGELLDPDSLVGDVDFDLDEDDEVVSIEVHIR